MIISEEQNDLVCVCVLDKVSSIPRGSQIQCMAFKKNTYQLFQKTPYFQPT